MVDIRNCFGSVLADGLGFLTVVTMYNWLAEAVNSQVPKVPKLVQKRVSM